MLSREQAPAAKLGPYQLQEPLGRGGMGTVYRARDARSGDVCALKVLHPWLSSPQHLIRFKREFRAAARLDHPHCLRVFELDSSGEQWFYAMEYAPGGPFRPEACASWQEAVVVALQVLAALDHIHAKRIIHRDIKPQNVLLDGDSSPGAVPRVRVADFGISKVFETEERALDEVLGTLGYLAPEQLDGQADPRSDLYALGVILYQALAGRHPLADALQVAQAAGSRVRSQAVRQTQFRSVVPLGNVALGTPAALQALVMRLLEPRPDDRYPTAASVFQHLSAVLAAAPHVLAPPAMPPLQGAAYLASPAFVGRAGETARLRTFLDDVQTGSQPERPFVCLVSGEAGAGKSRLMAELLALALRRSITVEAGAWRAEAGGPWALRGLFRLASLEQYSGIEPGDTATETTWLTTVTGATYVPPLDPGQWRATLPALVGSPSTISEKPAEATPGSAADPEGEQWALYRRLADGLIAQSRERALVFVFEDAHWADPASLELLGFLVRSVAQARQEPRPPRIGFLLTHRPVPEAAGLAQLRALASSQAALTIELQPLGVSEAVDLVCSALTCPREPAVEAFARRLYVNAEGNPLFIGQTLHLLLAENKLVREGEHWRFDRTESVSASLPRNVRDAIGDRAARLSVQTKWMLAAAAVVGPKFEFELLRQVSQIDAALLLDCLDEALRSEFIVENPEHPGIYQFLHERIRDAIGERLGESDRQEFHRRTAQALELRYGDAPEMAGDIGFHARAAGDLPKAQAAYERAAEHAFAGYAFTRAADFYGSAMELVLARGEPAPTPLISRHADACMQAGRYEQALAGYQALRERTSVRLETVEISAKMAEVEFRRGETDRAGQQGEAVLRVLGFEVPESTPACLARCVSGGLRAVVKTWRNQLDPEPGAVLTARDERAVAFMCLRLSEFFYFSDLWRALSYNLAAFHLCVRRGWPRESATAMSQQAYLFSMFGLRPLAMRLLDHSYARGASLDPVEQSWVHLMHGMCLGCFGDARGYARKLREGEVLLASSYEPMKLRQTWTLLGEALLAQGELAAADDCGQKVLRIAEEMDDDRGRGWALYVRGWVAARLGQWDRARALLGEAVRFATSGGDPTFRLCASGRLALSLLFAGELDQALAQALAAAQEWAARSLRHPSVGNDGIFFAAAALVRQRDGRLPVEVSAAVLRRRLLGREQARSLRLSAPVYWAGLGAFEVAAGRGRRGRLMIARAAALAEGDHLWGELHDVHAIAARVLPQAERAEHERRARGLQATFLAPPPVG